MSVADEVCAALKADGTFDGWRGVVKGRLQASRATDPVLQLTLGVLQQQGERLARAGERLRPLALEQRLTQEVMLSDVPAAIDRIVASALEDRQFLEAVRATVRRKATQLMGGASAMDLDSQPPTPPISDGRASPDRDKTLAAPAIIPQKSFAPTPP
eukprot:EG_transcript_35783